MALKAITTTAGMVKVPLTLITILSPASFGLLFWDDDLPVPRRITREEKNAYIIDEATVLGVTARDLGTRSGAVGTGIQPDAAKELIGRHISSRDIARIITQGQYWGNYQLVTTENDKDFRQLQLQFRPGAKPMNQDGILTRDHVSIVVQTLSQDNELVKVGGLWVHPKQGVAAFQANIVLRHMQEPPKHEATPVLQDVAGFYVKVSAAELKGICPPNVVFV